MDIDSSAEVDRLNLSLYATGSDLLAVDEALDLLAGPSPVPVKRSRDEELPAMMPLALMAGMRLRGSGNSTSSMSSGSGNYKRGRFSLSESGGFKIYRRLEEEKVTPPTYDRHLVASKQRISTRKNLRGSSAAITKTVVTPEALHAAFVQQVRINLEDMEYLDHLATVKRKNICQNIHSRWEATDMRRLDCDTCCALVERHNHKKVVPLFAVGKAIDYKKFRGSYHVSAYQETYFDGSIKLAGSAWRIGVRKEYITCDKRLRLHLGPDELHRVRSGMGPPMDCIAYVMSYMHDFWAKLPFKRPRPVTLTRKTSYSEIPVPYTARYEVPLQTIQRGLYMFMCMMCDPYVAYPRAMWQAVAYVCIYLQFTVSDLGEHHAHLAMHLSGFGVYDPKNMNHGTMQALQAWILYRTDWQLLDLGMDFLELTTRHITPHLWYPHGVDHPSCYRVQRCTDAAWNWFERNVLCKVLCPSPDLARELSEHWKGKSEVPRSCRDLEDWFLPPDKVVWALHTRLCEAWAEATAPPLLESESESEPEPEDSNPKMCARITMYWSSVNQELTALHPEVQDVARCLGLFIEQQKPDLRMLTQVDSQHTETYTF
ncbi:MAG: hypothetical protein JKY23_06085 [Nitrospinaceae bacterium]|nr:hypothetical protein [Nitrospinaceae bacterium]